MRFFSYVASVGAIACFASDIVSAHPNVKDLKFRRAASILIDPAPQPDLPSPSQAQAAAAAAALNLDDIQGDILIGMKKNQELFFFFSINNATAFKTKLGTDIHALITTTTQLLSVSTQPTTAVNIAFSQTGLTALNITDDLGDPLFTAGQEADAPALGDPGTANWVPQYLGRGIDGVFLLASDTTTNIDSELAKIQSILGSAITEVRRLAGAARPGAEQGHEHFGYMDGISQPAVDGFNTPNPGQTVVPAGFFLLGETSDPVATRPAWAKDGSFLAFRQLAQLVPEFNKFIVDNPIVEPGLTAEQGSALLGARMIGRWKSGAPVDLAPLFDDPVLAADPTRNNNFNFSHAGEDLASNQTRCPFSAHIRKTAPRADFSPVDTSHHIIRSGLPYGPEVSAAEAASNTTATERGLAFVAYQSDLGSGFHFLQQSWANNPKRVFPPVLSCSDAYRTVPCSFIFGKSDATPGFDPIIGANAAQSRFVSGLDPTSPARDFTLVTDFVQSRGGEYFFSPSLSAIAGTLSA
ncbi:fungal peroxidase [Hysterangium stoloniferum]|nr:fungal peroxidase [Hysterangium stoloniferum]